MVCPGAVPEEPGAVAVPVFVVVTVVVTCFIRPGADPELPDRVDRSWLCGEYPCTIAPLPLPLPTAVVPLLAPGPPPALAPLPPIAPPDTGPWPEVRGGL